MANLSTAFWLVWFGVSILLSIISAGYAFEDPLRYAGVIDLLTSIISILIGVSLAVTAVLVSPFSVSVEKAKDQFEAKRVSKVVAREDNSLAKGQLVIFVLFIVALFAALAFKWIVWGQLDPISASTRRLASISAFLGIFSLLWSIRLPFILNALARQRRALG